MKVQILSSLSEPSQHFPEVIARVETAGDWLYFDNANCSTTNNSTGNTTKDALIEFGALLFLQLMTAVPVALLILTSQWYVYKHDDYGDAEYGNVGKALESMIYPLCQLISSLPLILFFVSFDLQALRDDPSILVWYILRWVGPVSIFSWGIIYLRTFETTLPYVLSVQLGASLSFPALEMVRRLLGYSNWKDPRKSLEGNRTEILKGAVGLVGAISMSAVIIVWIAFDVLWLSSQSELGYLILRPILLVAVRKMITLMIVFPFQGGGFQLPIVRHFLPVFSSHLLGLSQAIYFCGIKDSKALIIALFFDWCTYIHRIWVFSDALEDVQIFGTHLFKLLRTQSMWGRLKPATTRKRMRRTATRNNSDTTTNIAATNNVDTSNNVFTNSGVDTRTSSSVVDDERASQSLSDRQLRAWILFCESCTQSIAYLSLLIYYFIDVLFAYLSRAHHGDVGAGGVCREEGSHSTLGGALFFPTENSITFLAIVFLNDFIQDKLVMVPIRKWAKTNFSRHLSSRHLMVACEEGIGSFGKSTK